MRTILLSLVLLGVLSPLALGETLHVPSQYPTVAAGVNAASPGDTVLVACGYYYEPIGISMRSGVCLRSETGEPDCAFLRRGGVVILCDGVDELASIEGFTIRCDGGHRAVRCENSSLSFKNCTFYDTSYGGGMRCEDSSPHLSHCLFLENRAGGYYGGGLCCEDNSYPTLVDCVFWDNSTVSFGGAIYLYGGGATLINCTFAENYASYYGASIYCDGATVSLVGCTIYNEWCDGDAAIQLDNASHANLDNCLVAFCGHYTAPLFCHGGSDATLSCCDLFGNQGGNWVDCIADQYGLRGNISEDPLFCNPGFGDLSISCNSPCAPFTAPNPECDLIGAWPIGCGGTPVGRMSWGAIKALFKE